MKLCHLLSSTENHLYFFLYPFGVVKNHRLIYKEEINATIEKHQQLLTPMT